jgi:succinate-semialdehyde dehydrogenase/glutarate-semialdehyde dehydrogenase
MTATDVRGTLLEQVPAQLLIDGRWRDAAEGATFAVEDPATGEAIAHVADATPDDARAALDAAVAAQDAWAATAPRDRGELLRAAFERVIERRDELALLVTLEMGKPLAESAGEVTYAAEFLRWFSEEAVRIDGRFARRTSGQGHLLTMRQPVGPCYMITPWNFPIALGTRKIGPAIAAGCTMVVKPAQQTPLAMLELARILEECGLPAGVLNVITTTSASAVSAPLLGDSRLRKLTFTGSTDVGRALAAQAAPGLLRTSMELGGNAPFVVFDDADLDAAVEGAVIAKMRNIGQACTAANRFIVQEAIAPAFTERLAAHLDGMRVGPGTEHGVTVGPLIDDRQRMQVEQLVEEAIASGAEAVLRGGRLDGAGYFLAPTVLASVPADARIQREEAFGPVAAITTFADEAQAVRMANDTEYGLVAYVYTADLKRSLRVCERLKTGMVGLNQGLVSDAAAPFGGVKASGFGREGGREGIDEYLETKYVAVAA